MKPNASRETSAAAPGQRAPGSSRETLVKLLEMRTPREGPNPTLWPHLTCIRATQPSKPCQVVYRPCLCIVAQGAKRVELGGRVYNYDPFHYLVTSVSLPVQAEIVEASADEPYLSLVLEIDTAEVAELLLDLSEDPAAVPETDAGSGISVSPMADELCDAAVRLLTALESPMDRRILAPLIYREILYHVLSGGQGGVLRSVAVRDTGSHRVARVIRYLQDHYGESLDIPTIARDVGMSTSSLHHTFKAVTSLTPLQYLKQIRLHQARLLMIGEGLNAGEAAYRVGYGSPSQFSREFKRLFGATPTGEVESFRALQNGADA